MEELVKTFHIDVKLMIAQVVNFTIVLAVLYYFGSKPLLKVMHARTKKIEDGIKNAELSEKNLAESEKQKQQAINEGRKEAQGIINQADADAEKSRQDKIAQTRQDTEKIVLAAKQEIATEREKMMHELKSELGELVLLASNKVSNQAIDAKQHQKLIDSVIEELKISEIK